VRLEHISKTFGGRKVLEDVTFRVDSGKAFCLLGRSGTGKSITLKIIIGLIEPDSGRVFVKENEVQNLKPVELADVRKSIGFLFQNAALFDSISVADNVAFPLRRHTDKKESEIQAIVREKLTEVELEKEGEKMPAELSGGMKKRAGLARALVLNPSVLLVDEPSSGLDSITASEIYELLSRLKKRQNVTLIAVTHDVQGARIFADRFAVLDRGRIAAVGTAEDLSESDSPLIRNLATGSER
jgi:phospholipid/cholesterol/gamma-HCH transport system ATP-binding protein